LSYFFAIFFTKKFHENAERSVAFGECSLMKAVLGSDDSAKLQYGFVLHLAQ
jgi:hypothetical protein